MSTGRFLTEGWGSPGVGGARVSNIPHPLPKKTKRLPIRLSEIEASCLPEWCKDVAYMQNRLRCEYIGGISHINPAALTTLKRCSADLD